MAIVIGVPYIIMDGMIVAGYRLEALACASVSVRLGARNISPTFSSAKLRAGTICQSSALKVKGIVQSPHGVKSSRDNRRVRRNDVVSLELKAERPS